MEDILIGVTDRSVTVFIPDPASTTGQGKTGLAAANLTVSYTRVETDNDVVVTDVTSSLSDLTALTDAHADWGVKEVSSTLAPGLYRLDIADAVFASGAWYAVVYVMITSGTAAATPKAFRLVAVNALDGVRMGLTALPNDTPGTDNGLPTTADVDAVGSAVATNGTAISNLASDVGDVQTDVTAILEDTGTTLNTHLTDIKGATFDGGTDSLEAIRNRGDAAWITATGFSTHSAADVWAAGTRTLTSAANITSTGGTITVLSGGVSLNTSQTFPGPYATDSLGGVFLNFASMSFNNLLTTTSISASVGLMTSTVRDAIADAALAAGDIDGYTLEEAQKLILAATAGKVSGAETTAVVIRAADDSKDRITATVDANGNRSAVTLDAAG